MKKELVKIRSLLSDVYNETYQLNIETLPKLSKAIDLIYELEKGNKKNMCRTAFYPFEIKYGNEICGYCVYYVSGKWQRIKAKTFKTKAGAHRFFNSLPLEY